VLTAIDQAGADALAELPTSATLRVSITQPRNPRFHRKFFALLQVGYDAFEPSRTEHQGFELQKCFDQFREDVIIASGRYIATTNLSGAVRLRAKSISFARMSQDEFESLYNDAANVLLQRVLSRYTRADLDRVVDRLMGF
jgi:hypothetical protein